MRKSFPNKIGWNASTRHQKQHTNVFLTFHCIQAIFFYCLSQNRGQKYFYTGFSKHDSTFLQIECRIFFSMGSKEAGVVDNRRQFSGADRFVEVVPDQQLVTPSVRHIECRQGDIEGIGQRGFFV